ncbi:MAG: methyltransferase [Proteobacteria bacterium SG_bin7]|nr:MAG: methyltransferase [Proteobacteria bacterium SG_bin7]
MYNEIKSCRICGSQNLETILNLGDQALTGVFPKTKKQKVGVMPLELVKCMGNCDLVQLKHTGNLSEFYGENYGYRSGLNKSMVTHLHNKVKKILEIIKLEKGDLVIDIGSNDSTTLQAYPKTGLHLLGMDPTGVKFKEYYPDHIQLVADFFSSANVKKVFGNKPAKVITSFSMFYDLEDPTSFMRQVFEVLDQNGIWVFEQSYMPTMLQMNSYDTICHEHLEYYGLKQIKFMTDRVGFEILDVEFNDINGGSFSIVCAPKGSRLKAQTAKVNSILENERKLGLHTLKPYNEFKDRIHQQRENLRKTLRELSQGGKKVYGYGASTKGNVLLQFCEISERELPAIAEVNEDKFGSFTPGTLIPIISEQDAKKNKPDYFLVLPWHFRENILARETDYLKSGGKFLFPLPDIEAI